MSTDQSGATPAPPQAYAPPPVDPVAPGQVYAPPPIAPPPIAPPPAAYQFDGQVAAGYSGPPSSPMKRGMSRRSVIGLIVLGVLFGGMALAGGIMAFLDRPADRDVVLPQTVLGLSQMHSSQLDAATAQMSAGLNDEPGLKDPQAAYYGSDGVPTLIVVAAKVTKRASAADQNEFFAGMQRELGAATLDSAPAGPFGGAMKCADVTSAGIPSKMCASIDSAAMIMVIEFDPHSDTVAGDTSAIISATER